MDKLRLLVTTKCHNSCPMCCNRSWNFDKLPIVQHFNYKEISITGGEPLLNLRACTDVIVDIHYDSYNKGYEIPKIFIYTSLIYKILEDTDLKYLIDGITYTPHSTNDVKDFIKYKEKIELHFSNLSKRINILPEVRESLSTIDLTAWKVKHLEWLKDCPVPSNEEFKRLETLI